MTIICFGYVVPLVHVYSSINKIYGLNKIAIKYPPPPFNVAAEQMPNTLGWVMLLSTYQVDRTITTTLM